MNGKKIRLSKSSISVLEKEAVVDVLDKEFLGMGEEVQQFEKEIRHYIQTDKEVVCVNTGTSALHLALDALGIGEGDEVLVPSLTYIATYQAISATGARPVSCEIDPDTLFLDTEDAEKRITQRTKVIMPVHYASNSSGMDDVYALAKKHSLRVVEDAAQAFGCIRDGKHIGVTGDIVCFSFDGIKNITSGEGGAILSSDKLFLQKIKDKRLLGVEKDTEKRYNTQRSWDFDVKEQGFRYHLSNIMATIGRIQLKRIGEFGNKRQRVVNFYLRELVDFSEISFLKFDYRNIISHIFVIKVQQRDALQAHLLANDIECGVHYKPNHLLSKYSSDINLPMTEQTYDEIITLHCHTDLTDEELKYIINMIKDFYHG